MSAAQKVRRSIQLDCHLRNLEFTRRLYNEAIEKYNAGKGHHPLAYAIHGKYFEMVKIMVEKFDCNVNETFWDHFEFMSSVTPIYFAIRMCNFEIVDFLYNAGAMLPSTLDFSPNNEQRIAIDVVKSGEANLLEFLITHNLINILKCMPVIQYLDVNDISSEMLLFLVALGYDVNRKRASRLTSLGYHTPLEEILFRSNLTQGCKLELLLTVGADTSVIKDWHWTWDLFIKDTPGDNWRDRRDNFLKNRSDRLRDHFNSRIQSIRDRVQIDY